MASIAAALERIPPGGTIVAGVCCGGPTSLLREVAARSPGRRWHLLTGLLLDDGGVYESAGRGDLRLTTWHVAAAGREQSARGLIDYLPIRASRLEKQMATWDVDAALVRVTPPDRDGWCSLGPSAGFALTAIATAKLCIAEVDETLPRTFGQSMVHRSALDVMVPSTTPTPVYRSPEPDDVSRAIARNVLALLPERPVLQMGIGGVPEALGTMLGEQGIGRLRFVGMGTEAMVDLFERGLLERPDGGPVIESPDLLGTQRLMRFAHENPAVGVFPSAFAHSPVRLAGYERLVSVNSALEVDLSGQVNSETVRGTQIAGIGGSLDFVEAATHSAGGMSIIALPSTNRGGEISRIVTRLDEDSAVTIPRGMVDIVVTEHGVARLSGKTLRERAETLIGLAAPQHRAALDTSALT